MSEDSTYDYVIIGAGSAGCVLAARLSENPASRVLLLESGGWDKSPWIRIPLGWGRLLESNRFDWGLVSEPEASLDGRRIPCKRGKVIGGSSSVNAMAYVRGNPADYDRWAAAGISGWSYADVLPYFLRQERWQEGGSALRGGDGPVTTSESRYADPVIEAWLQAGRTAGFPATEDYNGSRQEGFARLQATIGNGRRVSAASAYLHPARSRPNLTVWTQADVRRILIADGRAEGIECQIGGDVRRVIAQREVVLSAGVFHSPQLLMVSGIGDPDTLRRYGIAVAAAVPGVGRNLQDHLWANVEYERADRGTFQNGMRLDRVGIGLAQAILFRRGFWTEMPSGWTAFVKTRPDLVLPDIQLLFRALPRDAGPWLRPFRRPGVDGFSCRAVMLRPQSRGHIGLASADPRDPPKIHFDFLQSDVDRETLRAGIRLIRYVARQLPLKPFIRRELAPGADVVSDEDLNRHIRASSATSNHPAGTCRMGPVDDPLAVVDGDLRVRGVAGLRVVDASVMPDLVGGNINAAVLMIAEKAADLIQGQSARQIAV